MARRRPGKLSAEDRELWSRVTAKVRPIAPERYLHTDLPGGAVTPAPLPFPDMKVVQPPPAPQKNFRIASQPRPARSYDLALTLPERLAAMPVQVDTKTHTKLKRGKLRPEARIDLHGMTMAQAHPVLVRFVHDAYARQVRLVLVITGKGKDRDEGGPMPVPRGVLRHQVPQWLQGSLLGHMVLQITEAHRKHGGEGAYYVYLRRQK